MPIMRSAVMSGSHLGDLVPDLHGSVPESGDIEILDTCVSYWDGQPDPSMGRYSCDQRYTVTSREDTKHTFFEQPSINQSKTIYINQLTTAIQVNHAACTEIQVTQAIIQS